MVHGSATSKETQETNVWVVIPTFNEQANVPELLRRVFAHGNVHVLIVDDQSPDGTGQLAERLRANYPNLHVCHRSGKRGLGLAYRDGFAEALRRGASVIVQCDADLSHAPEYIPQLLRKLQDADLAVASRYVAGGQAEKNIVRRWISIVGNLYVRCLLGWRIHDWSSGYKAWRAAALRDALRASTKTQGYAFQMEMVWHARQQGARIVEMPIIFTSRVHGNSKFTWGIIFENIRMAWYLRMRPQVATAKAQFSSHDDS